MFCSVFAGFWTELEDLLGKSPYSVGMREKMDEKNSEYGQFLRSACKYNIETCDIARS